ncbi:MAG: transcriptional repressor [Sulfuricellaceae bacterium]
MQIWRDSAIIAAMSLSHSPLFRPEDILLAAGERATPARCAVLGALLAAERALTHLEIGARLELQLNRVTLYRVLEWLVQHRIAHKIVDEDRVWRFNASPPAETTSHRHAHFRCKRCISVTCLENMSTTFALSLPAGFRSQEVDLTISGICAACAGK